MYKQDNQIIPANSPIVYELNYCRTKAAPMSIAKLEWLAVDRGIFCHYLEIGPIRLIAYLPTAPNAPPAATYKNSISAFPHNKNISDNPIISMPAIDQDAGQSRDSNQHNGRDPALQNFP